MALVKITYLSLLKGHFIRIFLINEFVKKEIPENIQGYLRETVCPRFAGT
jgi:hypothetical protein